MHDEVGMSCLVHMITTKCRVRLCRILNGPKVITDRYNGKQDDDEQGQGNDRISLRRWLCRPHGSPEENQSECRKKPDEIEKQFHSRHILHQEGRHLCAIPICISRVRERGAKRERGTKRAMRRSNRLIDPFGPNPYDENTGSSTHDQSLLSY